MCGKKNNSDFFAISNIGGGGSDKYRENVYIDLIYNTPILINYYYIIKANFGAKWLRQLNKFSNFNDFFEFVQYDMINTENFISDKHTSQGYEKRPFLLDSGVKNFINEYCIEYSEALSINGLKKYLKGLTAQYLSFAEKYNIDYVICLDIGGKYTFKDGEKTNTKLIKANEFLKEYGETINLFLIEESLKYINSKKSSFKIWATMHGKTPETLSGYFDKVNSMQHNHSVHFDGYAIGGIASSKALNKEELSSWNINNEIKKSLLNTKYGKANSRMLDNILLSTQATSIIRKKTNSHIHCLGAGSYASIIPLLMAGANSFDSQTPGRRAYDGNILSSLKFPEKLKGVSYSKLLSTKVSMSGKVLNNKPQSYVSIRDVDCHLEKCDCPACLNFNANNLRQLYKSKQLSDEDFYLSKQIMNSHSINQHGGLVRLYDKHKSNILNHLIKTDNPDWAAFLKIINNNIFK